MWWKVWVIGCALAVSWSINAAVFDLPIEGSSIVGNTQYHKVEKGETLADIAKKYDIGFLALMAANRGVDPFLPQEGFVISIPAKIILPKVAYAISVLMKVKCISSPSALGVSAAIHL